MDASGATRDGGEERPTVGQGFRWEGDDPAMLADIIDAAFDYRGDVTILLVTGETIEGYLANRDREAAEPFIQVYPADGSAPRTLPYRSLRGIAFSGRDAASGKSWETWLKTCETRKQARARGENGGPAGLFPEPLDGPA